MRKSVDYFQIAIGREPLYAPAHAALADSISRLGFWGHLSPETVVGRGMAAAARAVELDDSLAGAHAALGFLLLHYNYSFLAAERECRRAVELDPRSATAAQSLSCCLMTTDRLEEGVFQAKRCAELDPLALIMEWTAGAMLYHARRYEEAIARAQKCLELDPSFAPPRWTVALSSVQLGKDGTGIPELEKAVEATGMNQFFAGALGYCYALTGRRTEAVNLLKRMSDLASQRYLSAYWPAVIHGALGEYDEAFRLLDIAYEERATLMPYLKVAPFFDTLRQDRRFGHAIRQMNYPESQ